MQKYTFDPETQKMTMVLEYELYDFMFGTARIGHENTYDMRGNLTLYTAIIYSKNSHHMRDNFAAFQYFVE